uniref:Reverse transcriptase domain-containing protein n=1 Tax=Tanacetum cinerariifolium TaxID=118510 RepID=A0A699HKC2_TANCI|nr:hypothetical protein [Tanacetum cinerariifolium]
MRSMFEEFRERQQATNLSTHTFEPSRRFNSICYDDDDDEERTIPLRDIISQVPPSIIITTSLVLRIEDPEVSFIMGNEELSTILVKESNEFIKSKGKSVTFSNPIFDSNDDFTSSDDASLSDEDVPDNNIKIYSNPLFEFDDEYISSDVNPLFDEDEYFAPSDDVELLLHHDPSTLKMSVASILEGFTDEPPFEENDGLFDLESKENKWKKILYDALIDDLLTEDKVFDLGIPKKFFSPTYVSLPFEDHHYLFFTYVVRILLLYFTYLVNSPFLYSSGSEDTIFDPDISAFHFSHRSETFISFNVYLNILNESPMDICSSTRFNPNITMI